MKTNVRGWLATVLASGLLTACSDPATNTGNDSGVVDSGAGMTDLGRDVPRTDVQRADVPMTMSNACASPTDLSTMTPGADGAIRVTGNNEAGAAQTLGNLGLVAMGGCINAGSGTKGLINVYTYTMRGAGRLVVSTANAGTEDAAFDTVVAILPTCTATATPLACNDDVGTSGGTLHRYHSTATTAPLTMGQTVFIVVGGYGAANDKASTGDYELSVREAQPIAVGMPCAVGAACVTDATCVGASAMNSGVCTANGSARTACRLASPFCNAGLECSVAAPSAATAGLCLTQVAPGATCDSFSSCTTMSVCPNLASSTASGGGDGGVTDGGAAMSVRTCRATVAETEPNNAPATPQAAVTNGTVFRAALPAGDTDCFAVTVPAGTTLYAETHDARGTCSLGTGADTVLRVYRQGETTPFATHDDIAAAANRCSILDGRATASLARVPAGTYTFCVSGYTAPATDGGAPADAGVLPSIAEYFLTVGFLP